MNTKAGTLESRSPHDNSLIASYEEHSDAQADGIIEAVTAARRAWATRAVTERSPALKGLAAALLAKKSEYASLMALEMGKPVAQAEAEIEKCAWVCEYYAEQAPGFLAPIEVRTESKRSEIVFRPLGNVLAIMPWNFPWWQAFRFAVPAIAAGNGVVLKHAANVTGSALAIEAVFGEALPADLLRTLVMSSGRVARVIEHDGIAAVTFTGSTGAGRRVASVAGSALKKCVLELGGSDPYVVLASADIDQAAEVCAKARLVNSGQSCIAAKRFIVEEPVYEKFVDALLDQFARRKTGDPMSRETDLGPMAREDLALDLGRQVDETVSAGAKMITGGRLDSGDYKSGAYYAPTILTDVEPGMVAFSEELFGPVAPVIRARNAEHAIALANDSEFGLGGAIFTGDVDAGWALACDGLETGTVAINGQVQSDPRLPFGGIKSSGYGRELGEFGIREFVNVKTVSLF